MVTDWIENWFGSEYYSLLYKHRDSEEAHLFLNNLIKLLNIKPSDNILDCGCGKGRHAIYLSKKGFNVTGIDISESSIQEAKKHENKNLEFFVHDVRNLFRTNYYDVALSLFTSFGYFDNDHENNKAIKSISISLKKGAIFVLDFMNSEKEIKRLVAKEKCSINNIKFNLHRYTKNNCIVKDIQITAKEKQYNFRENVKAYKLKDLEKFLNQNNIVITHLFGDYNLSSFDEAHSNRLIITGRKK